MVCGGSPAYQGQPKPLDVLEMKPGMFLDFVFRNRASVADAYGFDFGVVTKMSFCFPIRAWAAYE